MPEATPSDVRVEIDTDELDDPDISHILDRVAREWQREYDSGDFVDTAHIRDFEASLAALRIAEGRDRRTSSEAIAAVQKTYETAEIEQLRKRVRRADPGDVFGHPGEVIDNTDRYTGTTDP